MIYLFKYEMAEPAMPSVPGLTTIHPAYVRDRRTNQFVGMMFDDAVTVRNLRRMPDDASLQDRMDVMLGRVGARTLLDGTVIRPQTYQSIVVTRAGEDETPSTSMLTSAGEHLDGGVRGVGRLVRDGILGGKDTIVQIIEAPKKVWTGYREEFDSTRDSLENALNMTQQINSTMLADLKDDLVTNVGLVETQIIDSALSLIDVVQEKMFETAILAKKAAEIPVEYVKETSSQVVRNLAIATVLASVLLAMYKFGDL
jgi:hypothetical protein